MRSADTDATAARGDAVTGYVALFALLFALYTLTNAGRFHVIDEAGIFAVIESLALRSQVNINAIAWTQWANGPGEALGAFGELGNVYSKEGPGPAFAAVPWYLLLRGFALLDMQIGLLQGTLLWNGLVTAATALLLWNTAVRLGYAQAVGCALGVLFGTATIAWPYANMLFGEPLSAFALLLCFWGLLAWRKVGRNRFAFMGGIGAGLAIATVTAHASIVAAFAVLALVNMVRHGVPVPAYARRTPDGGLDEDDGSLATVRFGTQVGLFVAPIMLAILFVFLYNAVRFGSGFEAGSDFISGEGYTTPLLEGAWGLLVSPYRGVLWHTPFFLLSLLGLPWFFRRHRLEATSILAGSVLLIGTYSMWWMWWGGFAWGPRFLVPFTPLWVLLSAPVLAASLGRVGEGGGSRIGGWTVRPLGWLVLLVTLSSVLVQVAAVSANFVNFEMELRSRYPTDGNDPLANGPPALALSQFLDSPVVGQLQLLATGQTANLDLAWIWPDGDVRWLIPLLGAAILLTLGAILVLWLLRTGPGGSWTPSGPLVWLLVVLPILLTAVWLGEISSHPHYGEAGTGYRGIMEDICAEVRDDDALITVAPFAYQIPMNWLGAKCVAQPEVLGYAVDSLAHPEAETALARALEEHSRIWFVTGGLPPNDPENLLERRLADVAHKAQDTWYADYRLLLYGSAEVLAEAPWFPIATPLVGRGTSQIVVLAARMPDVVMAGDVLATELYYELAAPSPSHLRWFVQLLADTGEPVALLDTAPQGGYASFMDLPVETELMERAGIWVPPDTPTGDYRLIAGLYNPEDAEAARLRAPDGSDHVELGVVRVVAQDAN